MDRKRDPKRPSLPRENRDWVDTVIVVLFFFVCLGLGVQTLISLLS